MLAYRGVKWKGSTPRTPQSNEIAERGQPVDAGRHSTQQKYLTNILAERPYMQAAYRETVQLRSSPHEGSGMLQTL